MNEKLGKWRGAMKRQALWVALFFAVSLILFASCTTSKAAAFPTPLPFGTISAGAHGGHDASSPTLADARMIMMDMREFEFSPKQIRAKPGESITIMLINEGTVDHDLRMTGSNFHVHAEPHKSVTASFVAPCKGVYELYCSVAGHKEAGMTGKLLVE